MKKTESTSVKELLDLQLIIGEDKGGIELGKAKLYFQLKPQKIAEFCRERGIQNVGKDVILKFDFVTQQGRQQDAIQYFQIGLDEADHQENIKLSPLQQFKRCHRSGQMQLYQSKRSDKKSGVTLQYRFYHDVVQEQGDLISMMQGFEKSNFMPDFHLDLLLMGKPEANKRNRIKLKIDHARAHLTSKQFTFKDFLNFLGIVHFFGGGQQQLRYIKTMPLFKFFENAQEIKGSMTLAPMRQFLRLFGQGWTKGGQYQYNANKFNARQPPQVVKGLFKQQLQITFVYADKLGFKVDCRYENEAVLVRILTGFIKYIGFFD